MHVKWIGLAIRHTVHVYKMPYIKFNNMWLQSHPICGYSTSGTPLIQIATTDVVKIIIAGLLRCPLFWGY